MDISTALSIPQSLLPMGQHIDSRPSPTTLVRPYLDTKPERNLWREQEMLQLLDIMRSLNAVELLNDKTVRSETVFRNIEKLMHNYGYRKKTYMQIWTKWKFLKSTYTTSRRAGTLPKVIPLAVYESLHELLNGTTSTISNATEHSTSITAGGGLLISNFVGTSETSTDGNNETLSINGNDSIVAGGGGGDADNKADSMDGSDACFNDVSLTHDEGQILIANVQGGVMPSYEQSILVKKKIKAPPVPALPTSTTNDINGFGVQHPIFGYRLGIVKQEPIDTDYENNSQQSNPVDDDSASFPCSPSASLQFEPQIKMETVSPPPPPPPPPTAPSSSLPTIEETVPPVPIIPLMPPLHISPYAAASRFHPKDIYQHQQQTRAAFQAQQDRPPPALKRFAAPATLMPKIETTHPPHPNIPQPQPHLPRLKHVPLRRITLQPRNDPYTRPDVPLSPPTTSNSNTSSANLDPVAATSMATSSSGKKIPVLHLRKRSRRLRIPMSFTDEPCPYSKEDDDEDLDDDDDVPLKQESPHMPSPPQQQSQRIPSGTQKKNIPSNAAASSSSTSNNCNQNQTSQQAYNKAMRDLSTSLRTMQREMIDDFFSKQMQLAREEHEFQKHQDEMLLQCFEEQTKMILDGAKSLFTKKTASERASAVE